MLIELFTYRKIHNTYFNDIMTQLLQKHHLHCEYCKLIEEMFNSSPIFYAFNKNHTLNELREREKKTENALKI